MPFTSILLSTSGLIFPGFTDRNTCPQITGMFCAPPGRLVRRSTLCEAAPGDFLLAPFRALIWSREPPFKSPASFHREKKTSCARDQATG